MRPDGRLTECHSLMSSAHAAYPKYPPRPVVRCDGYRPRNDADKGEPGDRREDC
jgi:hypothetical protein